MQQLVMDIEYNLIRKLSYIDYIGSQLKWYMGPGNCLQCRRKENRIGEDDPNFGPFLVLLDLFMQCALPRALRGMRGVTPRNFENVQAVWWHLVHF